MTKFYQVGGSIRDEIMGLSVHDKDYAVEAESFAAMRDAILAANGRIFLETPRYFTIRALIPTLGATDYVLCRKDGPYNDGRHPESVEVGTIYDDLARRDFTVNAMARNVETNELIDPYGGQLDIRDRMLHCVGRPQVRFTEDGLRMLRAIRFSITKGFTISDSIHKLLCSPVFFEERLQGVSMERIREELLRCFQHNTIDTLNTLDIYRELRDYVFERDTLWLKPTNETNKTK